jgi:hypothetical protein
MVSLCDLVPLNIEHWTLNILLSLPLFSLQFVVPDIRLPPDAVETVTVQLCVDVVELVYGSHSECQPNVIKYKDSDKNTNFTQRNWKVAEVSVSYIY